MVFLFRSGTVRDKIRLVLRATRQHARNLALYAGLYKLTLYVLRSTRPSQKELAPDTFVAGLLGGYIVFGRGGTRQSNVNQQVTIYVFARVVLALAKLIIRNYLFRDRYRQQRHAQAEFYGMGDSAWTGKRMPPVDAWPLFASLSWAFVMYLFRWYPETLQPSLRSSMKYMSVLITLVPSHILSLFLSFKPLIIKFSSPSHSPFFVCSDTDQLIPPPRLSSGEVVFPRGRGSGTVQTDTPTPISGTVFETSYGTTSDMVGSTECAHPPPQTPALALKRGNRTEP